MSPPLRDMEKRGDSSLTLIINFIKCCSVSDWVERQYLITRISTTTTLDGVMTRAGQLNTTTSVQTGAGFVDPFSGVDAVAEQFESSWTVSEEIGCGVFRKVEFQDGFDMYSVDCRLKKAVAIKASACSSVVCMRFNLSGQNTVNVHGVNRDFTTTACRNGFYYFNHAETSGHMPGNQHLRGASIHFDPDLFLSLIGDDAASVAGLRQLAEGKDVPFVSHSGITTPQMQTILYQIINCPYCGPMKKVFLESKALELLFFKLHQIAIHKGNGRGETICSPGDVERIRRAGELLIKSMESPPSLSDLGKAVGMSRTKLHTEFSKYFGITPFSYLREARLSRAKLLLDLGEVNVTEAALAVGFSSLSHFAKAFKNRFGVAPGKFLNVGGNS